MESFTRPGVPVLNPNGVAVPPNPELTGLLNAIPVFDAPARTAWRQRAIAAILERR